MSAILIRRKTSRFTDFRRLPASRFKPEAETDGGGESGGVALLSDDGEWYLMTAVAVGGGATLTVDQTPVDPGVNEYLVLENLDDGLKYIFRLVGAPPVVFWQIDAAPTAEDETPTTLVVGAQSYELNIVTDQGLTYQLTPV